MYIFELPEVGEGVVEAEIVKWLVEEGEFVQADQAVCEVMTDKATIEISSPKSGLVHKIFGEAGDIVEVHTPFLEIDESVLGGATSSESKKKTNKPEKAQKEPVPTPQPVSKNEGILQKDKEVPKVSPKSKTTEKTLASPAVRMFADQQGVDINTINGTGASGRVTRGDIQRESMGASLPKAPPAIQAPVPRSGQDEVIRIIGLRRKIAQKMVEAVQFAPHFTYVDEIDATALVEMRKQLKPVAAAQGVKITYLPFIMKALVEVFKTFPTVNAIMNEQKMELTVRGEVNIGIATDTPNGLYVPVIKNVEQKSILELAREIVDITTRTREGKVGLDELTGGTFTITSVGNIGGRFATPIINHPEVAILGVNQIHDRPMVIDGAVVPRKMMYLSPSFDHRIIDGAVAARFVSALKAILENPASLVLSLR
jgi:pyruvate dehydrogenase E2 component (dihydrolipoamide acetyltransferase)